MQTPRTNVGTPVATPITGSVGGDLPEVPEDGGEEGKEGQGVRIAEEEDPKVLELRRLSQLPPKERCLTLGVYGLPHVAMKTN